MLTSCCKPITNNSTNSPSPSCDGRLAVYKSLDVIPDVEALNSEMTSFFIFKTSYKPNHSEIKSLSNISQPFIPRQSVHNLPKSYWVIRPKADLPKKLLLFHRLRIAIA